MDSRKTGTSTEEDLNLYRYVPCIGGYQIMMGDQVLAIASREKPAKFIVDTLNAKFKETAADFYSGGLERARPRLER